MGATSAPIEDKEQTPILTDGSEIRYCRQACSRSDSSSYAECEISRSRCTPDVRSILERGARLRDSVAAAKYRSQTHTHRDRQRSEVDVVSVYGATLPSLLQSLETLAACKKARGWYVGKRNMTSSTPDKTIPELVAIGLEETGVFFNGGGVLTVRCGSICDECGRIVVAAVERAETMIRALRSPFYVGCATAMIIVELTRIVARCGSHDNAVDLVSYAAAMVNKGCSKKPASVKLFVSFLEGQDAWNAAGTSINCLMGWRVNAFIGGFANDSMALGIAMSSIIDVHLDSFPDGQMVDYEAPLRDPVAIREYGALIEYHCAFIELSLWRNYVQDLTADIVRTIGDIPAYKVLGDDLALLLIELVGVTEHGNATMTGFRGTMYVPWLIDLAHFVFMNSMIDVGQEVDLHELGVFAYDLGPANRRTVCERVSADIEEANRVGDPRVPGMIVANYMYAIVDERHSYRQRLTDALAAYVCASERPGSGIPQPLSRGPDSRICGGLMDAVNDYVTEAWLNGEKSDIATQITHAFFSAMDDLNLDFSQTHAPGAEQMVEPIVVEAIATHAILPVFCAYGLTEKSKYEQVGLLTNQPLLFEACLSNDMEGIAKVGRWVWPAVSQVWFGEFALQDYASGVVIARDWDCALEVLTLPGDEYFS